MRTIRDVLNEANPNKVDSGLQIVRCGDAFALIPRFVSGAVATDTLLLPQATRATAVLSGYATAGGTTGPLTPVAAGATPATTEVGISADGNILFAAADAVTAAEVVYVSLEGDVVTETIDVTAAGVGTPNQSKQAQLLISADLTTGASTGVKTVIARGGTPAAGEAAVADDGTLAFLAADVGAAGGTAEVAYVVAPGSGDATVGLAARLAQDSNF